MHSLPRMIQDRKGRHAIQHKGFENMRSLGRLSEQAYSRWSGDQGVLLNDDIAMSLSSSSFGPWQVGLSLGAWGYLLRDLVPPSWKLCRHNGHSCLYCLIFLAFAGIRVPSKPVGIWKSMLKYQAPQAGAQALWLLDKSFLPSLFQESL
jgi:hypothetical protein